MRAAVTYITYFVLAIATGTKSRMTIKETRIAPTFFLLVTITTRDARNMLLRYANLTTWVSRFVSLPNYRYPLITWIRKKYVSYKSSNTVSNLTQYYNCRTPDLPVSVPFTNNNTIPYISLQTVVAYARSRQFCKSINNSQ